MSKEYTDSEIALCRRIEKVLSEILSDKHDCKVTLHFLPKELGNGGGSDERTAGEEHRELRMYGA
jgi:hypothetical protein